MTHMPGVPISGTIVDTGQTVGRFCRKKCKELTQHKSELFESSCGGYEDYRYTCTICGAIHWVDGIDS